MYLYKNVHITDNLFLILRIFVVKHEIIYLFIYFSKSVTEWLTNPKTIYLLAELLETTKF